METTGLIRRFGSYTMQQLDRMKADLKLDMPVSLLAFCASYYRTYEKRDPAIEELKMLDLFAARTRELPHSLAPTELLTNDTFVAQTYADMMKKRHELNPDAKAPATLAEAMNLAGAYLGRAGKTPSLPSTLFLIEDHETPHATHTSGNSALSPDSRYLLRTLKRRKQTPEDGDLLVLLRPAVGLSFHGCNLPLARLLESSAFTVEFKQLRTVGEQGLLYEILHMTSAAEINLLRLSETGETVPLPMLTTAYGGDLLVQLSSEHFAAFANEAHKIGVRALAFGCVRHGTRITFRREPTNTFSLESSFLRALFPLRPLLVKLSDESRYTPTPIAHTPRCAASCAYLAKTSEAAPAEVTVHGDILCAVASSSPESGFFRNALETALVPVLTLAAAGCDFTVQRTAVGLTLPKDVTDPTVAGEVMSVILGLYRLQTELALPLATGKLGIDEAASHPAVTAFAMAEGTPCPSAFTGEGNRVYCIAPEMQADGIPVFTALRSMLDTVASLRRRGILQSARVLCREAVTDGVRKMSNATLTCRIKGNTLLSGGALPLALLLETAQPISAEEVGVVCRRENAPTLPNPWKFPARDCMIWTERPTVTVFSDAHDADAKALVELLTDRGAVVTHLQSREGCAEPLSHAILGSQTLIVCRVALPDSPRVAFAADTLRRGGGRILLLGGAEKRNFVNGFALSDGIFAEMIDQICQKPI